MALEPQLPTRRAGIETLRPLASLRELVVDANLSAACEIPVHTLDDGPALGAPDVPLHTGQVERRERREVFQAVRRRSNATSTAGSRRRTVAAR